MPFDPMDLIKFVPANARRVLEIAGSPSPLLEISRSRSPLTTVTSKPPEALDGEEVADCVAAFSPGADPRALTRVLQQLPPRGQALIAPDAFDAGLDEALIAAGCQVFEVTPIRRAWKADRQPDRILLHCSVPPGSARDADTRIHRPNGFLRAVPGLRPVTEIETFTPAFARPNEGRILVLHRSTPRLHRDLAFLRLAIAEGYLIVLDLDDDPRFFTTHFEDDGFALRSLHAAQVSTQIIADRLAGHVNEIAVFPNQVDFLMEPSQPTDDLIRIFFGAYNREADRDEILEPLNRVLAAFGDKVMVEVVHDRGFFDGLRTANKRFVGRLAYRDYLEWLGECDIALLPLRDTPFNRCKSDLKFLECAARDVAVLASPTVYAGSVIDGVTGVLFRNPAEFMVGLQRLILERDLRDSLTRNARNKVRKERMLADHYTSRHAWYVDLLSRADDLRAAHRERAPELYD